MMSQAWLKIIGRRGDSPFTRVRLSSPEFCAVNRIAMSIGRQEYNFFWSINNYSYCRQSCGEALVSPYFTADGLESSAWTLHLYPRGKRVQDKGFISLFLKRSGYDGPEKFSIMFELSVLKEDGSPISLKQYHVYFLTKSECGDCDFLKMDVILMQRNFPQDILRVRCKIWKGEGDFNRVAHIYARTQIEVEVVSFLHEVKDFSKLEPNQKHNLNIPSNSLNNCSLLSSVYFISLSCLAGEMKVVITPPDGKHVLSKRKISLLDASGNVILCDRFDNRFDVTKRDLRDLPLSITRQEIMENKIKYLLDDKLSLQCECSFSTGQEYAKIEKTQYEIPMQENAYSVVRKASVYPSGMEDIKELYMSKCLTDVELKTETKSFPAHKMVLCARSPVFKRMLTSDMKERNTNCIRVDDLEDDVVQQLLLFMYSDRVENLEWGMATRLHFAADKYQVGKLKEVSISFLVEHLTPTTAGELLLLADTHSDDNLKKLVEDFILEHEREVFGSKQWEKLMETNPLLAMKAMHMRFKR
ncbi:unnamed protein product [Larinioides sclopetarius]|uniref:Speckle-type POZ protein n=1 Tax=Larinioides sclopetarius TaxID=280406 RepID=A0AAV1ZML2_9ARAC